MADEVQSFAENGGQILTFMSDGRFFAFEILAVTDIIEIPEITPIPKTPAYISGIINHRGKAVPVMDFRKRLGFKDGYYNERSCIIVVEINSMQIGITVDMVADVENVLPNQIALSPVESSTVKYFVSAAKKRISVLDPERLVRGRR